MHTYMHKYIHIHSSSKVLQNMKNNTHTLSYFAHTDTHTHTHTYKIPSHARHPVSYKTVELQWRLHDSETCGRTKCRSAGRPPAKPCIVCVCITYTAYIYMYQYTCTHTYTYNITFCVWIAVRIPFCA
jgi:hypothetical protein